MTDYALYLAGMCVNDKIALNANRRFHHGVYAMLGRDNIAVSRGICRQ